MVSLILAAAVVESVDTGDLKSPGSDTVRVRVPSAAPKSAPPPGVHFLVIAAGLERPLRKHAGGMFLGRGRVHKAADAFQRNVDAAL